MTPIKPKDMSLALKIREAVSAEQEKLEAARRAAAYASTLADLVARPDRGRSRLRAHRGELRERKARTRRASRIARASRRRNRP